MIQLLSETARSKQVFHRGNGRPRVSPTAQLIIHMLTRTVEVQWNSWLELGVPASQKGSGGDAVGVFWIPSSQDPVTQTRSYALTGHHNRAANRTNYHLLVQHWVMYLEFSNTLRATGVTIQPRDGARPITIKATKEIILAAGAYHSPPILQRSGIGPKALLERAGGLLLVDLPGVGQNLQDHPYFRLNVNCKSCSG